MEGLAKILVNENIFTETEMRAYQKESEDNNKQLVNFLCSTNKVNASDLCYYLSSRYGFCFFDLDTLNLDNIVNIDFKLIQKYRFIPLSKKGKLLYIATSDPFLEKNFKEIKFHTQYTCCIIVVEDHKLESTIDKIVKSKDTSLSNLNLNDDFDLNLLDDNQDVQDDNNNNEEVDDVEDAPIVKFLQKVLIDAINTGVSDIHFEPYEKSYRIRYRLDGELYEAHQVPLSIKEKLASRIKVISKLNISEKRIPQDGRMKLILSKNKAIDFRVSTLPTVSGEKIVMRILDPSSATLGIDALGYEPEQKESLLNAINRPYGMVLVTGPTGSGKTVSLYTCLNILNSPTTNISTAEDPAEINLHGINQVNVNDKQGLTFAAALKSFLRQDPDIIMVGEIRDLETADIAIKASQTGHLVLSTLHTNDAPQTLTRLMNMGVAPFNIASSIHLITAQRLGRRLCKHCKIKKTYPNEYLIKMGYTEEDLIGYNTDWFTYYHNEGGCTECHNKGYKGRVGVYQVMPITDAIREIILKNGTAMEIDRQAQLEGVKNLRQSGLLKVKQGLTSVEEIDSITNN